MNAARWVLLCALPGAVLFPRAGGSVTVQDIENHFKSLPNWDRNGNDGYERNDHLAGTTVTRVAVGWMPTMAAVQEAHSQGCQLFIGLQGLFPGGQNYPGFSAKKVFLDTTGLVVLRCYDVWKTRPEVGIRDSLKTFLGLTGNPINPNTTDVSVYSLPSQTADEWAAHVAGRMRTLGVPRVERVGNGSRVITSFAIGSGIETEARTMFLQGAQAGLITEFQRWREVWWAIDNNVPMILVDHYGSEARGH